MTIRRVGTADPTARQAGLQHPSVRIFSAARRGTLPRDDPRCAVSSVWGHQALLSAGAAIETFLWCRERSESRIAQQVGAAAAAAAATTYLISPRTLGRVAPGEGAGGLLSVARLPAWTPDSVALRSNALVLVVDGVEYAGNLGTLLRDADGAGADLVVLTNAKARVTNPKVFVASRATVLTMPILEFARVEDARVWLREWQVDVYVAQPDAPTGYREPDYARSRTAFVLGSERQGPADAWLGGVSAVSIPMRGRADSLNVGTSAAVLLYEARAQKDVGGGAAAG
ncbi:MAG TPA: TrmH family RNA methyltransferase [Nocardioidaceae bacterium]|nr:TrmH family RNA methyltransferase [Nocardioidaceae bacterium]